jgi:SAM-dependent methyltransferase
MTRPSPDFARAAGDYAAYRPAFDARLFDRLRGFDIGRAGQQILDVGAGSGLLGRPLLHAGCRVVECDPALDLLRQASGRRAVACAEQLPFADEWFDAVTAAQCWHWFDRGRAPAEIHRVLTPGGRVAVIYQTYLPIAGTVAHASEKVILKYRPGWRHAGGVGVNGQALKDLQASGFTDIESFSFDVDIPYDRDAWAGFIRTCSAVAPSLPAEALVRIDAEHMALLSANWPARFTVPHRIFAAVARRP